MSRLIEDEFVLIFLTSVTAWFGTEDQSLTSQHYLDQNSFIIFKNKIKKKNKQLSNGTGILSIPSWHVAL